MTLYGTIITSQIEGTIYLRLPICKLVRQADIADILVSLSRLQLVQSSKNCVRMELLLLIFSMLTVDFAVAARDKSAGSLALLVSDVPTH